MTPHLAARPSVASHLARVDAEVAATYHCLLAVARGLGPVTEAAKKSSIHLVRRTAFAGVATRRSGLRLTVKSQSDISSPRIIKRDFEPGFFVEHFIKDLGIVLAESKKMGLSLPGQALAEQLYLAVKAQGFGKKGTQALMLALEQMSGVK